VLAVTVAGWASLTAASSSSVVEELLPLLPLLAAVIILVTPFAVAPLLRVGLGPALRGICRDVTGGLAVIVAAAAVVALFSGVWAAQRHGDASAGELASSPMQPAGSFLVDRVPDVAMPALRRTYEGAGGRTLAAWQIPEEVGTNLRVTSPTLVRCLKESGSERLDSLEERCWPQVSSAPVNTVMLGPADVRDTVDPQLLEDGQVGLLLFKGEGAVSRSSFAPAVPDATLGGLAPGLVVAADGPIAREYGLRPSGMTAVALLDFSRLDARTRLTVRAEVARLAAGAQTSDGTDPTAYDRLRSTADLAALLGAAAAAVLLALGLGVTVTARAGTRRILVDLGGTPRLRLLLLGRWLLLPAVCALATAAVTMLTATYGLQRPVGALGASWLLPSIALLLVTLLATPAFLKVPDAGDE
jgi:hypothetical protein